MSGTAFLLIVTITSGLLSANSLTSLAAVWALGETGFARKDLIASSTISCVIVCFGTAPGAAVSRETAITKIEIEIFIGDTFI